MHKKTLSLLEELDSMFVERDRRHVLESRANNIITSAINLIEQIERTYNAEQAEILSRKLVNAIQKRDPSKFSRSVRKTDADL